MPIEFLCSECNRRLRVADDTVGKKARCPDCGNIQNVPTASSTDSPFSTDSPGQVAVPDEARASGNPFADSALGPSGKSSTSPDNPYQSPETTQYPASVGFQGPLTRRAIEARLQGPAIALIALSTIVLAFLGFAVAMQVVMFAMGEGEPEMIVNFVSWVIAAAIQVTVLIGAQKMKRLQNYPLAVTASVLTAIPCFGCCILGLPFGIWSLVVLCDPQVRAAFR